MPLSTGRFGPRYGTRGKKVVAAMEVRQCKPGPCPYCEREALSRIAAGIWTCKKCGVKFAGGAYTPRSATADIMIKSKQN